MSIFANIMRRTASQILDVTDAEVWVMEPRTESFEQTRALKDTDLYRVGSSPSSWQRVGRVSAKSPRCCARVHSPTTTAGNIAIGVPANSMRLECRISKDRRASGR